MMENLHRRAGGKVTFRDFNVHSSFLYYENNIKSHLKCQGQNGRARLIFHYSSYSSL